MRILHVVPTYYPAWQYGGPLASVHGLCKGLTGRGHTVQVFTTNVSGTSNSQVPLGQPVPYDGIPVWYFESRSFRRVYWAPAMAKELRSQIRFFDLVHLHSVFLWPTAMAARISRKEGVPYVLSPRGMLMKELLERKSRFLKKIWIQIFEKTTIHNAAGVHFTSRLELDRSVCVKLQWPHTTIIPNGFGSESSDPDGSASEPFAIAQKPYLLFLGRIHPDKGLERLIRAFRSIKKPINLILAGNGEKKYRSYLERMIQGNPSLGRVQFAGYVSGKQKQHLLSGALALVLPSCWESFGNVVLEAMAAGRAVAVTPHVGAADVVLDAKAGRVLRINADEMGQDLDAFLTNEEELHEMGMNGKRYVAEHLSWNSIAAVMEAYYQSCIDKKREGM